MAEKFNAKNLYYEKKVPAFLQRLQGQYSGDDSHQRIQQRRAMKLKSGDDEEDEPTYVDEESGEVVGREEYARLVKGEEREDKGGDEKGEEVEDGENEDVGKGGEEENVVGQKIAEIGAGKKRKVGRVVGEEEVGELGYKEGNAKSNGLKDGEEKKNKSDDTVATNAKPTTKGKSSKKKKIKLSFDEDE